MKSFFHRALLAFGVICILVALILTLAYGFTVGNCVAFCAGISFIGIYFLYFKLSSVWHRLLNIALIIAAAFMLVMITFIAKKGSERTVTFGEDAVLVLGCGIRGTQILPTLQMRLDKCLDYLHHKPNTLVIVSGGQGYNEDIPEAEAMQQYLILHGVSTAQIVVEDQSRNTQDNMRFSKLLLDSIYNFNSYTVACVTSDYHAYRASVLAKRNGISATKYNANTKWYLKPSAYCREVLSICKMWIMN